MANISEILNIAIDAGKNPRISDSQFEQICDIIENKLTDAWFKDKIDMDTHFDLLCKLNKIKDRRLNKDVDLHSSTKPRNRRLWQMQEQLNQQMQEQQHIQMIQQQMMFM